MANTFKGKEEIVVDVVTDNCKVIFYQTYAKFVDFVPEKQGVTDVMLRINIVKDQNFLISRF